jgi:TatD DNase family protein
LFQSVLKDEKVYGAVGCHPKHAVSFTDDTEVKLRAMLQHEKVIALGEIGLDYSGK